MIIGVIIFGIVISVFLILYFKRGFYEALITTSIVATIGVLFIPDAVLLSFYLRLLGRWRLIIITMNQIKIIIIVISVLFLLYLRENKHKFKEVIS